MNTGSVSTWMEKMLMSAAVLTCSGQYQVTIENFKNVRALTEDTIEIQSATCRIRIRGDRLRLKYFTKEVMKITGRIESIEYMV